MTTQSVVAGTPYRYPVNNISTPYYMTKAKPTIYVDIGSATSYTVQYSMVTDGSAINFASGNFVGSLTESAGDVLIGSVEELIFTATGGTITVYVNE